MVILTPEQVLERGLKKLHVTEHQMAPRLPKTNEEDFAACYGPSPLVVSELWRMLQTSTEPAIVLDPKKHFFNDFLIALHWMKLYPTERSRKVTLSVCRVTGRKWSWFYARRIAALKDDSIVWPPSFKTQYTVTVDGVHFHIKEPTHPDFKIDTGFFSHKHGGAGLDYEIAISIFEPQVLWINGPYPSGIGDREIFKDRLRAMIPPGHIALMDRGYRGGGKCVSTVSALDCDELNEFKTRALARHENFNSRLKRYAVLRERFRCDYQRHRVVFTAVTCICQLEMTHGCPLFDV